MLKVLEKLLRKGLGSGVSSVAFAGDPGLIDSPAPVAPEQEAGSS